MRSSLSRRQRRALEVLGRQISEQDPELAAQLSRRPRAGVIWASRVSATMFVTGVVLLACGIAQSLVMTGTIGAVLLLTYWMPPRMIEPTRP